MGHYGLCAFAKGWHMHAANAAELLAVCLILLSCRQIQAGMTGASLKKDVVIQ